MTNEELQRWTGYRHDAITPAVRLLVDLGWLTAHSPRGPWVLTEGFQLPLTYAEKPHTSLRGGRGGIEGTEPDRLNPPPTSAEKPHIVRDLIALGIHPKVADRIALIPNVSMDLVKRHIEDAAAEGATVGLAVYRLENKIAPKPNRQEEVSAKIDRFKRGR